MMDYKYIEQLLERYFEAETTLEEERILHTFFSQEQVPAALEQYKPIFCYGEGERQELGSDFDERIMSLIGADEPAKAKTVSITERLMPLFRAAAIVAIVLTLGNAAQAPWDRGYGGQTDSYAAISEEIDSTSLLTPVHAENVADTAKVEVPTY